jgi:hypothetical protein
MVAGLVIGQMTGSHLSCVAATGRGTHHQTRLHQRRTGQQRKAAEKGEDGFHAHQPAQEVRRRKAVLPSGMARRRISRVAPGHGSVSLARSHS